MNLGGLFTCVAELTIVGTAPDEYGAHSHCHWQVVQFAGVSCSSCPASQRVHFSTLSFQDTGIGTHCHDVLVSKRAEIGTLDINQGAACDRARCSSSNRLDICRYTYDCWSSRVNEGRICIKIEVLVWANMSRDSRNREIDFLAIFLNQ